MVFSNGADSDFPGSPSQPNFAHWDRESFINMDPPKPTSHGLFVGWFLPNIQVIILPNPYRLTPIPTG